MGKIPWRREWLPTPVFLPGESHGQRSLAGCRPRGHEESDMTEHPHTLVKGGVRWEPDFWSRAVNRFSGSLTSGSEGLVPEDQEAGEARDSAWMRGQTA